MARAVIVLGGLVLLIVCADSSLRANNAQQSSVQPPSPGRELAVLIDVNPHQEKVLPVELDLAEGVVEELRQPGSTFTVITFGDDSPTVIKSRVDADEALAAIRAVRLGRPSDGYLSAQLYRALNLAFDQFPDDARPKSVLVITEGNDYPRGNALRKTVSRAQRSHVICNVAMVADHTFYGTKSIQKYGFFLRRLVGKTHGRYVEVGGEQKEVPHSVEQLSESIREQGEGQRKARR
jgi:uncharacterized protein (DUF58 family)